MGMYDDLDLLPAPQGGGTPGTRYDDLDLLPEGQVPQTSWSDTFGRAAQNFIPSGKQYLGDVYNAVTHPIQTIGNVADLGAGAVRTGAQYVLPEAWVSAIDSVDDPANNQRIQDTYGAVKDFYVDRYGSGEGFRRGLSEDPVGVISDLSVPLTGGAGLLAKTPGMVGKVANVVAKTAELADPISLGAKGVALGAGQAGKLYGRTVQTPLNRAIDQVGALGRARYGDNYENEIIKAMNALGPDAVRGDVLGEPGYASIRQAANLNPAARETLTEFGQTRKDSQNIRLMRDVQDAGGVPVGSRKSVDDMSVDYYKAARPAIDSAYTTARDMGKEIPFSAFDDILGHPAAQSVFETARQNVVYRERLGQPGGNLAILDETKRLLDKHAGDFTDPNRGIYTELSKNLRERTDQLLMGPEYETARNLREQAYRGQDAFDIGVELGGANVPINAPQRGAAVDSQHAPNMAAAYAQTKAGMLYNNNNGASALSNFSAPGDKEAMAAGLGPKAPQMQAAIDREGIYNRFVGALGNSTTARQLIEAGQSNGIIPAAGAAIAGFDPTAALTIGAVGGVVKKYLTTKWENAAQAKQAATAPSIADILVSNKPMPTKEVVPPNIVQRGAKNFRPGYVGKPLVAAEGINESISDLFGGPR